MKGIHGNASFFSLSKNSFHKIYKPQLLFLFLTFFLFSPPKTSANYVPDPAFNAGVAKSDAQVYVSKVLPDGKILVGGNFILVNDLPAFNLVRLNADGSTDTTFNSGNAGANNTVNDIAVQSDGKFIVGGVFTTYNGTPRLALARINSDGSIDASFNANLSGVNTTVNEIALQADGKILISGRIPNSIMRLNSDGSIDSSFTSPFSTSTSGVEEIAVQSDGKILIGGTIAGNIARLNADGSFDSAFSPTEVFGDVYAIEILSNNKILIGGSFLPNIGNPQPSIRRLNADGSTDNTFSPFAANAFNWTKSIAVLPNGKILIAGILSNNGIEMLAVVRLNADGTLDNSFSVPAANDQSYHVALQSDGKILLGGGFSLINGQSKPGFVRLNSDGSADNTFNASFYAKNFAFDIEQQTDGKILVGGSFNFANGISRSDIARFNLDGTLDTSFNTGTGLITDPITCCKLIYDTEIQPDGKILLAGVFNGFNGVLRRGIVRLNSDGSVDTSFTSEINGGLLIIYDLLVLPDGKIIASTFGTDPTTGFGYFGLVRLNSDGSYDTAMGDHDGIVHKTVRQSDGKIIIGGSFFTNRIKRLNADGSNDTSFNVGTGFNSTVTDLLVQPDGKIVAVGTFTQFNGTTVNRIARLNSNGSLDTSFNTGSGANAIVRKAGLLPNGKIAVGGEFTTVNGIGRNRLAILNADGSPDTSFQSGFDGNPANSVRSVLVQADGKLIVGGHFDSYNGAPRNALVRLRTSQTNSAPFDFDGDNKTDLSVFRPSNGQWWYLRSSDSANRVFQFGNSTDRIMPADYTGDGKTDIAVWRPATGEWFILRSEDNSFFSVPFGTAGDLPAPADFDADGKADIAVFRSSTGTWYINKSSGGTDILQFGLDGDVPVPADYDGDGRADLAIFRPSNGQWWLNRSTAGVFATPFGVGTDKPVAGDYTGDGKTDIAVWRPMTGEWFILRSEDLSYFSVPFGLTGDIPAAGDFDGDGKYDLTVFRPSQNTWYINRTTSGLLIQQFGSAGDKPVPSAFVP